MSGGSYEYVSSRIADAATTLREYHPGALHVLALAELPDRVADVMHKIEWADSRDTLWTPALDEEIRALIRPSGELAVGLAEAKRAMTMLHEAIEIVSARHEAGPREQAERPSSGGGE